MSQKRFGYYTYKNKEISRFDLMRLSWKTGAEAVFHPFSIDLDSIDLTIEPPHDLNYYYRKRAEELRQKYDHIILAFSGGTDSEHVFRTFYNNGIRIDEILHYHYDLRYRDRLVGMNIENEKYEHEQLSIPLLKHIKSNLLPDIEITIIDTTRATLKFWKDCDKDWHEKIPTDSFMTVFNPAGIWRADISLLDTKWNSMLEAGKKICLIAAKEKLMIGKDETGYFIQYRDLQNSRWLTPPLHRLGNIIQNEMFYMDDTTIEMQLKQAHVLRRELGDNEDFFDETFKFTRQWENTYAKVCYGQRSLPLPYMSMKEKDWVNLLGIDCGYQGAAGSWFMMETKEDWHHTWKRGIEDMKNNMFSTNLNLEDPTSRLAVKSKKFYFFKKDVS